MVSLDVTGEAESQGVCLGLESVFVCVYGGERQFVAGLMHSLACGVRVTSCCQMELTLSLASAAP